jgi:glycosyltransferase involved in cell wall biosynthesis
MHTQCEQDSRFSVIDLSHNFGHQPAIAAGLAYAEGDAVIIMDGDLQDPPEVIPDLLACWQGGAQVVRAQRRSRQERGFRRLGFELFHKFFNWISDFLLPGQTGIFGLLDRQAVLDLIGSVIGFIMFRLRPEKEGGNRASSNFLWIMPAVVFFILWIIGMMKA